MTVELNYILLNKIFDDASKKKRIIKYVKEDDISKFSEPIFISDDIRIYRKENLLYIYLDEIEVLDNFFNVIKDQDLFKNVDGVILSYKKSIEYELDKEKLNKILKKISRNADKFLINLMKYYDKETSKKLTKVALMGSNEEINDIDETTILDYIDIGYKNIINFSKNIGIRVKESIDKLIKKITFKD